MFRDVSSARLLFCSGYLFSKRTLAEILPIKEKISLIQNQWPCRYGPASGPVGQPCLQQKYGKLATALWQQMCIHSTPQTRRPLYINCTQQLWEKNYKKIYIWHIFTSSICQVFQHLYSIHYIYLIFIKEQGSNLFSLALTLHKPEAALNGSARFSV